MSALKTGQDLLREARGRVRELSPRNVIALVKSGAPVRFLDVRDLHEVNLGKIPGAVHISRGNLESKIESQLARDAQVIVYCANGNRSVLAADTLQEMGYHDVVSLAGGFRDWVGEGGEVES